jgi:hypothetical protein
MGQQAFKKRLDQKEIVNQTDSGRGIVEYICQRANLRMGGEN